MPESAEKKAERKRRAREAARRRSAVTALNIGEATCRYASTQLSNGLGPAEARDLAQEMAAELVAVARILRRVGWLPVAERRVAAARLRGLGYSTNQIADRLGVTDYSVREYLRPRTPAGGRPA